MEKHEYTKNMENLEMPLYGFRVVMEPENFRIFLQHVVVNVYKISNHSDMVMFLAR